MTLTVERLQELLRYDSETGEFWGLKGGSGGGRRLDKPAGSKRPDGYVCITVDRRPYLAHRLAWLYTTGAWPEGQIDHRDTVRSNNRFSNLRDCRPSDNLGNMNITRRNTSGHKGVSFDQRTGRWYAQINREHSTHFLGRFSNVEDAADAYRVAAVQHFGDFARAT